MSINLDNFINSEELLNDYLEKGRKQPIGSLSKDGKYRKVGEGKWEKIRGISHTPQGKKIEEQNKLPQNSPEIGKTSSGKSVYEDGSEHEQDEDWSSKDHVEAEQMHTNSKYKEQHTQKAKEKLIGVDSKKEELANFEQELKKHDWYYDKSDDHKKWQEGSANEKRLSTIASKLGAKGQELYDKYKPKTEKRDIQKELEEILQKTPSSNSIGKNHFISLSSRVRELPKEEQSEAAKKVVAYVEKHDIDTSNMTRNYDEIKNIANNKIAFNSEIKNVMNALQLSDNRYSDLEKVSVESTPKGNWRLYYRNRDTGITIKRNLLSEDTIDEYNLKHYDDSEINDLKKGILNDLGYNDDFKIDKTGAEIKEKLEKKKEQGQLDVAEFLGVAINLKNKIQSEPTEYLSDYDTLGLSELSKYKRYSWAELDDEERNSESESGLKRQYNDAIYKFSESFIELKQLNIIINGLEDKKTYSLNPRQAAILDF